MPKRIEYGLSVRPRGEGGKNTHLLQTAVRQAASQQAVAALRQLPWAPGTQRQPRRAAAVQASVWEQRALSVSKKKTRDFHPIGPSAAPPGRAHLGLWREPRDGAAQGSTEKTLCC